MKDYTLILKQLNEAGNLRSLPDIVHTGNRIERDGQVMLNLSSNDYLGLASRSDLREALKNGRKKVILSPPLLPAC